MGINPDAFDDYEEGLFRPGGGGGGKKKEGFGAQNRDKVKRNEIKLAAKESDPRKKEALKKVTEKVNNLPEKDIKEYLEWLRLGLLCAAEIERMKKDGSGDLELALEMMMSESDLKENFVRSAGAGGQNVNKVNSAVQLSHRPSGIYVKVQESRDQSQNRERARERLREKLGEHLADWRKAIGDRQEDEVIAEVLQSVAKK
jgi:hypothetical protein